MKAMILAAGLGTRLRPLSDHCAKPAMPIRGRPVVSLLLEFLNRQGIRDIMINLHYLPETIRGAVENDCPRDTHIVWSDEPEPLGTGGGIRRAADFLSGAEECIVLSGDMLIDIDLATLIGVHHQRQFDATFVLLDDARSSDFGTIGIDAGGCVTRVGKRTVADNVREDRAGLFTGVRIFSRRVFDRWPDATVFEDLRDWLMPGMEAGAFRVGGAFVESSGAESSEVASSGSVWEPVGTPNEYLRMNLDPPLLPSLGGQASQWSGDIRILGAAHDVIVGTGAEIGENVHLERAIVWAGEKVPAGLVAQDGVFAAGRFHDCGPATAAVGQKH
jgi:mannose-1-phosphate guanylyltransferase